MVIRQADPADLDQLATVWHRGWFDAHAAIVPAELVRLRTLANFRDRLAAALDRVRVADQEGRPLGFCMFKDDEIYQFYVAAEARGTGVAAALMADAEAHLSALGIKTAWLACAIGNDRAARFYEKCGWRRVSTIINEAETSSGSFPLEVWRYEKNLSPTV